MIIILNTFNIFTSLCFGMPFLGVYVYDLNIGDLKYVFHYPKNFKLPHILFKINWKQLRVHMSDYNFKTIECFNFSGIFVALSFCFKRSFYIFLRKLDLRENC